ncbi:cellulose binding domain-containing protein [Thermogemmatispora carboxidivorans]|uniref:cellulose binding domain-containing protein n=1 Tax=Thermogemmatispora carboxidivorans TaxID=1382306 RepID=UPI00069AC305|nr:cellulose binding domain-containing protein [Thermogemmatispora carboxidivorans]
MFSNSNKKPAYRYLSSLLGCATITVLAAISSLLLIGSPRHAAQAASGFVTRCGIHFCLNGQLFYYAGANSYDIFTFGDGSSSSTQDDIENKYMDKAAIDAYFSNAQSDGITVVRTWMFDHETWHGFEPSKGVYNVAEFDEFDYIIQSAKAHNIRLIPVFENYWEAYGGIDTRLQWEGLPTGQSNRWRFFNQQQCPGCFTQYKNYVSYALNHVNHYSGIAYKDEPTIFAWELMNEPRYENATPDESTTGTTLRAWVDTMGAFIKGIDPNHMLGTGLEGQGTAYGYGGNSGNPFVYIHQSPYIDFTSAHFYPTESWANLSMSQAQQVINKWVSDSHNVVGKPFILGEFNSRSDVGNRTGWWTMFYNTLEQDDADGDNFWMYVACNPDSIYGVTHGAPELAIFLQHSQHQQQKSGGSPGTGTTPTPGVTPTATATAAASPTPTPRPTVTPTPTPSPTPAVTPTPTLTPTPSSGLSCRVHYAITAQWPGGFGASISITNTGSTAINGWTLKFTFPNGQTVTQGWNGSFSQQGSTVTITNLSYNATIPAGATLGSAPGFNGTWNGTNSPPTSFTLNGVTCSTQ